LRGSSARVELITNDGELGKAFSFGTVTDAVRETIDRAPGALVLHWPIDLRTGRKEITTAIRALRRAGALAVRLEQSKVGWSIADWLKLFGSRDPWAWHRGAIAFLSTGSTLQSCGMHAFSLPDVRIATDGDARAAQELASILDIYQLDEDPVIRSGETFAPDASTPRRLVERWPDVEYPPDHACHNPYGVWRIGPPGGTARSLGEHELVFVPSLRAILGAQKSKLTKKQLEAIRDNANCIAMTPRDAQRLERERGYADLDPELAWEQWKLLG
jgi:hypothetical protein